jgi:hypothetical protein
MCTAPARERPATKENATHENQNGEPEAGSPQWVLQDAARQVTALPDRKFLEVVEHADRGLSRLKEVVITVVVEIAKTNDFTAN